MREVNWEGKMILRAIPESWRELFIAPRAGRESHPRDDAVPASPAG